MPVKIRLARHGRKSKPFYHIVVADSRAPRDGKFIEKLGVYNPNTDPATIDLNFDSALDWLGKGAQPTDTCRAILSYKGVLYKRHLLKGVAKGALTQEEADAKFQQWLEAKQAKIDGKISHLKAETEKQKKERLEAEAKINAERAEAIARKKSELAAELAAKNAEQSTENADAEQATPEEGKA